MEAYYAILVVLILVLVIYFSPQICGVLSKTKTYATGGVIPKPTPKVVPTPTPVPTKAGEWMNAGPKVGSADTYEPHESDTLTALGYSGSIPWSEAMQFTELDPSVFDSQAEFVSDVRRFSSGANFTSVNDDDVSFAFVNFVGLRRPQHVNIGETARQIPDIDETVLQRSKVFRWSSTS